MTDQDEPREPIESREPATPEPATPEPATPEPAVSAGRVDPEQFVAAPEDSDFTEIDPDVEPEANGPRPSALHVAGRVSVRVITGIFMVAVVAVVLAAASMVPLPSVPASSAVRGAPSTVVTPIPTAEQLVCPGGLLRLASASGKGATKASSLGVAATDAGASSGSVTSSAFSTSDAGTGGSAAAPQLLSSPPIAAGSKIPTIVAGAQSESISTDEFAGLASAACSAPSADVWLSGGATSVGRTTLLMLANPSDVLATVSIHIFGENGAVTAPGTDGIIVAPRGQRVLSLAGFAPGLVSPVVHVQSAGGQVVATLEQSTVRGIQPGGMDFVGSSANLERTTVIPGVAVTGTSAVQGQLGESGFEDLQTTLRVYLPGVKSAQVSVSVVSETGTLAGKAITAEVNAGKVTDLPIDSLPDGSYTIIVRAPVPVLASVRVSTAGSAADANRTDFAWLTSAPLLTTTALVTIATGMTPSIHFDNPTRKNETVTLTPVGAADAAGSGEVTVTVPAGAAVTSPVVAGATYSLGGYTGLYAAVSGVTDGGVTGYVVSPAEQGSTPIRVYG
ncbi:MAG: hypothetical protein QOI14_167 [Actinomycetota bacterium]|nr:hypothetical protein [Actinomycetota bacterium]